MGKEYDDAYVSAHVRNWIAYQIRTIREQKSLSQAQLADILGTKQSVIARIENSNDSAPSVHTLIKIAAAFDCGLIIKFVSKEQFHEAMRDVSPDAMRLP